MKILIFTLFLSLFNNLASFATPENCIIESYNCIKDAKVLGKFNDKNNNNVCVSLVDCEKYDSMLSMFDSEMLMNVEVDGTMYLTNGLRGFEETKGITEVITEGTENAVNLWGLDILDNKTDGMYTYAYTGKNVNVYVVDSGISKHHEFISPNGKSRLKLGKPFSGLQDTNDCVGHGTHVASTIGGNIYGVAKESILIPIRVFGCGGGTSTSNIVEALYWILTQPKGIVNMSLGGTFSTSLNNAVKVLSDNGFVVVVAAGNEASDACNRSPSSASEAITVGCINVNNEMCYFSNFGKCVDIFAPGYNILGARYTGGSTMMSGTSMSTPHVSGVMAQIKQKTRKFNKELLFFAAAKESINEESTDLSLRTISNCKNKLEDQCTGNCKFFNGIGCRSTNFCGFLTSKKCKINGCNWNNSRNKCF